MKKRLLSVSGGDVNYSQHRRTWQRGGRWGGGKCNRTVLYLDCNPYSFVKTQKFAPQGVNFILYKF